MGPNSPLRTCFCSRNAFSSASSSASIAAPLFGLTSPCNPWGRPKASPKFPPDRLRTQQFRAGSSHHERTLIGGGDSLHFEDLTNFHCLRRRVSGSFLVMLIMTPDSNPRNYQSKTSAIEWACGVHSLLIIGLECERLAGGRGGVRE